MKLSFRSLTLAAGERERVHGVASFFMLVDNTGTLDVHVAIENDKLSQYPKGFTYQERKDGDFFSHIDFYNPNAGSVVVSYVLSGGLVVSSPTIMALDNILAELKGVSTGENWGAEKIVGTSATQIFPARASRHSASIQAKSTNSGIIYVGYDSTVIATKWIAELQPGQSYSVDDWTGAIWLIATAAGQKLGYGEH